jgi:NitT/TauT family transport system substrate-binding protein
MLAMSLKRRAWMFVAPTALVALLLACGSNNNKAQNASPAAPSASATKAASAAATSASAATTATSPATSTATATQVAKPAKVTKIVFAPDWFTGPENAGELMAKLLNLYPPDLDVEIRDGGPSVSVTQQLATGQIQMGTCTGIDNILVAKQEGIDLVALFAPMQISPQVLIAHKETGIKGFEDMKGKSIAVSDFVYWWDWLVKKYGWSQSQRVKYNGTLQDFLLNKELITQGYYMNEPYYIQKQGQQIDMFLIADAGFNPYAEVLCTSKSFLEKNPDAVREFVQAAQKGYLAMLDPKNQKLLFDEIQRRNKTWQPDAIAYSLSKIPDLMFTAETATNGFGTMSDERWKTTMQQMIDVGELKGPLDYKALYTNEYLDKSIKGMPPSASPTPVR